MHSHSNIIRRAQRLMRACDTRDPFAIARQTGVEVLFYDLGRMKGFYALIEGSRMIAINENLEESMQRIVCAHELGHDSLHRALARTRWLQEFMNYGTNTRAEYEANLFAAELLLPDADLLELFRIGYDAEQAARALGTHKNLVALKLETLRHKGAPAGDLPREKDFLRR